MLVQSMRGVYFNRTDTSERKVGVIAQEIEKVLPEVVLNTESGMKSVAYGNIVGVLLEAMKEMSIKISELEKSINDLKGN
jgi:hypothetical protein